MQYRAPRPEEIERWHEFMVYCFGMPADYVATRDQWLEPADPRRGLFDAHGQLQATLELNAYSCLIDGAALGMGGIGVVASLPENRRGGLVAQLLQACIAEMREREMPLSTLFPFKQSFYRRYGWEVAGSEVRHLIPLESLDAYRSAGGVVRRFMPKSADWRQLAAIYEPWALARRGYLARPTQLHWQRWVLNLHASSVAWHTALWQPSATAAAEGYLLYGFEEREGMRHIMIHELVAGTSAAERGLWGFIAQHDSQAATVQYDAPRDWPLWHLIASSKETKSELRSAWQLRLVDLPAAWQLRPWPAAVNGALTIGVSDVQAAWNQGAWRLSFEAGRASVAPAPLDSPDLAADVQTWAQLYAGLVRPEPAAFSGRLAVHNPAVLPLLSQSLAGDPLRFFEHF